MTEIHDVDEYFDVDKTEAYALLTIWAGDLTVERLSELLGLKISYYRKKGEYPMPNNKLSHAFVTLSLESNRLSFRTEMKPTFNVSEQIEELISKFKDKVEYLNVIQKDYNCIVDVCVVLYNRQKRLPGMNLDKEHISFLASIGVGIDFDIYT